MNNVLIDINSMIALLIGLAEQGYEYAVYDSDNDEHILRIFPVKDTNDNPISRDIDTSLLN